MASAISGAMMHGETATPLPRVPAFNPLAGTYASRDGRWVVLGLLQGFHQWPMLCQCLGQPAWITDPRFAESETYAAHLPEVQALLEDNFAREPVSHWRKVLANLDAVWEIAQDALEASRDPQAAANGYIAEVDAGSGIRANRYTPARTMAQPSTTLNSAGISVRVAWQASRAGATAKHTVST